MVHAGHYSKLCLSRSHPSPFLSFIFMRICFAYYKMFNDRHLMIRDGLLSSRSKLFVAMRSSSSVLMNVDGRPLSTTS
jgi:hypothetical protein